LPDARLEAAERGALWRQAAATLEAVSQTLPAEDRVLLRMRFWQGLAVADIAEILKLDAKPLYRRYERLLRDLRHKLAEHGIGPEQAAGLFAASEISMNANIFRASVDTP
jgi:DNA-directed RNA polymerase specialized sigma24 family protein